MTPEIKKIRASLKQKNLDAVLLSSAANISYLTHLNSRDSYFLVTQKDNIYFTDSRYTEEVKPKLKNISGVKQINGSLFETVAEALRALKLKNAAFEERNLEFAAYLRIKKALAGRIKLVPAHSLVEALRQIKTEKEIEKIKKALKITVAAFSFIKGFIRTGKKEIEIAAELERFIRYHGSTGSAFDLIIASGPNSALPHHRTSQRKIKSNEPVLVDIGIEYEGYKTDLTRVFFSGKIPFNVRKIYDIVRRAQEAAIEAILPAAQISGIDAIARQHITQAGYGGFFGHNLGHGVGLEVHEAPSISAKEESLLKPGMVFTIEPGIYLPGKFGIRIEDMVLVTEKNKQVLSAGLPK